MTSGILEQDSMFSVKERTWHNLDIRLNEAPSIQEAIKLINADYIVETEPAFSLDGQQLKTQVVKRTDTNQIIGEVGSNWHPLQNKVCFDWFQPFIDNNKAELETGATLYNGAKLFILAKINIDHVDIRPNDTVIPYLLLSNVHDGTQAATAGLTPVRVECQNTLNLAIQDHTSKLFKASHTANIEVNMERIQQAIQAATIDFQDTAKQFKALAKKQITEKQLKDYFQQVFKLKKDEEAVKKQRTIEQLENLFTSGQGNKGQSYWDAYNAVTEFSQYFQGKSQENRINNNLYGPGKSRSQLALQLAIKA